MGEDTTLRDALSAAVADVLSDALKISALTSENDIQRFADELPEIADSDEDNDKVIKAVTVLKRLGYQLRHAKSISFLADAFLVRLWMQDISGQLAKIPELLLKRDGC